MKKFFVYATGFLLLLNTSCYFGGMNSVRGEGEVTEETRDLAEFYKISAQEGLDIIINQDEKEEIVVRTNENLQEYIMTEVKDGKLKIYVKEDYQIRFADEKKVLVSFTQLEALYCSSGADIHANSDIHTNDFTIKSSSGADINLGVVNAKNVEIDASSGADIKLQLFAETLDAKSSSAGDIKISGQAAEASLSASSGADIKGDGLEVKKCTATASSGGDVSIHVTEELTKGSASSGGDVRISGQPKILDISESSGGDVKLSN